jgi:hypothetical protein
MINFEKVVIIIIIIIIIKNENLRNEIKLFEGRIRILT